MKTLVSRRSMVTTGAMLSAGSLFSPRAIAGVALLNQPASPIRLGLTSYTFRNFDRSQLIGFIKQLDYPSLNAKDIKDHLPTDPAGEDKALADYKAAGISLHAAGTLYLTKDEDADIRSKFEYCKRAGVKVMVAGDPTRAEPAPHRESLSRNSTYGSPSTIMGLKTHGGTRHSTS